MSQTTSDNPQENNIIQEGAVSDAASDQNKQAASLLDKIEKYEKTLNSYAEKNTQMENELKQKDAELLAYKKRITQLEEEATEAQKFKAQHAKESEEVASLQVQSEDTLTRAKSMLFERTKVIKNQELQIDALNQQISSLKDVVAITKDLLEIRNLEIKQLETKIKCMEDRVSAEKERHDLMHKKLETMIRHNGELKREYETQLCLFSALRERYSERELAKGVVNQMEGGNVDAGNQATTSQINGSQPEEPETPKDQKEE